MWERLCKLKSLSRLEKRERSGEPVKRTGSRVTLPAYLYTVLPLERPYARVPVHDLCERAVSSIG